jgi:S-DNA-T family DNA segregation ATPase FtsK/SpoIIIE
VFGSQHSGKTNVCELLAQQWQRVGSTELREMYFVAGRSDALWDALAMARRSDQSGRLNSCKTLWIFDDLDVAMSGLSPEHAAAAANEFVRLVQDRPDSDLVVATGSRLPAQLATQLAGVANRLYLRAANKDQHVNWGLPLVTYRADAPAGRAIFRGLETQVAHSERQQPRFVSACASIPTDELLAVVTSRHDEWRGGVFFNHEQWRVQLVNEVPLPNQSAFSGRTVVLGEPEDWIGNPMTVTQLRSTATFLFDRTSPAEVRQITRRSALPPPVFEPDQALLWRKGGGFRRLRLARHPKQ